MALALLLSLADLSYSRATQGSMEAIAEAASTVNTFTEHSHAMAALPASATDSLESSLAVAADLEAKMKARWDAYAKFPVDLSVSFPLEEITLSHLAQLRPGIVLRSSWPAAEDIPLSTGDVFLANVSFEPAGTRLGVRLNGFAPRPVPSVKRQAPPDATEEQEASVAQALDTLKDLRVSLSVCVGTVQVQVEEILQWAVGDTIPLDRPANAPVNLLLKDRIVAGGNLVLVAGFYAVQLTGVAPRSRRLPSC
jgi:flagellar motor switch protein FliN